MQIQRTNRTDAEKVYIVVHNVEATSITTGQGAYFVGIQDGAAAASVDGKSVVRVGTAANMAQFAGVAAQDIVADGYGRTQIWGWCDSIMLSHRASNTTIGAGIVAETILTPSATLVGTFSSTTPQDALSVLAVGQAGRFVQIFETVVLSLSLWSTGGNIWGRGFVRGL